MGFGGGHAKTLAFERAAAQKKWKTKKGVDRNSEIKKWKNSWCNLFWRGRGGGLSPKKIFLRGVMWQVSWEGHTNSTRPPPSHKKWTVPNYPKFRAGSGISTICKKMEISEISFHGNVLCSDDKKRNFIYLFAVPMYINLMNHRTLCVNSFYLLGCNVFTL